MGWAGLKIVLLSGGRPFHFKEIPYVKFFPLFFLKGLYVRGLLIYACFFFF